ncbi:MAG: tRNA pseudouridine(13) synthase TruD [bacterium]|nr:tRNA pseudouridine(13) synthase TruD [bacterium]
MNHYLLPELEPIAFQFRQAPEDFVVHEIALQAPQGTGEHLYLHIEKTGLTTEQAIRILGRALGRPARAFGYAGRKDKHAVTRQWLSVQGGEEDQLEKLHNTHIQILDVSRGNAKLRRGAHAGNRFTLELRGIDPARQSDVQATCEALAEQGLPNRFGAQRHGGAGMNAMLGRQLVEGRQREYMLGYLSEKHMGGAPGLIPLREVLAGDVKADWRRVGLAAKDLPRQAVEIAAQMARRPGDMDSLLRAIPKGDRRFHVQSLQSALFDDWVAVRMNEPSGISGALAGDWVRCSQQQATRLVDSDQELSPGESVLGPLFGKKMRTVEGRPLELENQVLANSGLGRESFEGLGPIGPKGGRRLLRVSVAGLEDAWHERGVQLRFVLPSGAYATTLLDQIGKKFHPEGAAGS